MTSGMYSSHSPYRHTYGFQSLIAALNEERVSSNYTLSGTNSYLSGARNYSDSVP